MSATKKEISKWFDRGVKKNASHLIVVHDQLDHDDYPIYVTSAQNVVEIKNKFTTSSLQEVVEIYSLSMSKDDQLKEDRAWHL